MIIDNRYDFHQYLEDKRIKVLSMDELGPDYLLLTYEPRHEYVESGAASNIVVSMWTTAMARVKLYHAMKTVLNIPEASLLYCDTVSDMHFSFIFFQIFRTR